MPIDNSKKSSRLLQSRRYTHDGYTDGQEAFTSVLDINAAEVYTDQNLIPSSSLPFSGSGQSGTTYSVNGQSVLKYYYRQTMTKSNLNNEVWFVVDPSGSSAGIGAQLIDANQKTSFISPKYSVPALANATAEDSPPGYLARVFITTTGSGVVPADQVSTNNYAFDYKTGVLQFSSSGVAPSNSQYVSITVNQYVGRTVATNVPSASIAVSSSYATTASYAANAASVPAGTVSSSTQIVAFGFATTGSNSFNGNQTITGSLIQGLEGNIATGENSHAEGSITKAIGNYSHAEGDNTQAIGDYSHAEGQETIASGSYSHAEGYQTIALANHQHVQGQYNAVSSVPSAFIVGNGTDDSNRSNLIYAAGNEVQITGSLKVTNGITGSLYGTASRALTASYAANAASVPAGTVSSSAQVVTYVSGSTIVPNRVESNEYKLIAGAVSLTFTGSITSGIFGATEYILPFIPTSSFCATTVEYVASRVGGLRVGIILAGWSGSQTTVTDVSSTDIGDTSDIRFSLVQDGGYIKLRAESLGSGSYPWTVQSLFKLFPFLS